MQTLGRLSWIESKLFLREPLTVIFSLALPVIILFVLGGVFGNEADTDPGGTVVFRGVGAMTYYVPAYLALVVASVCVISIPTHLAGNRERGVLKRFHASSVDAWTVAGAEIVVAFVISTVSALILLLAAGLMLAGSAVLWLTHRQPTPSDDRSVDDFRKNLRALDPDAVESDPLAPHRPSRRR